MAKNKKIILRYKVTNKNILIRFKKAQKEDKKFTLLKLAEKFGIFNLQSIPDKTLTCRWISLNSNIARLPSKTRMCPSCRKSVFEYVEDWINDGSLN